jgi:hypothetical protein
MEEDPPKFVICYLFDDDYGASLDFKALSADKYLQDDFIFMAVQHPSYALKADTIKQLPNLVGRVKGSTSLFYF